MKYSDALHLLCSGKFSLSNNFIENINNSFRDAHTPSACPHTHTTSLDHSYFSDLEAFRKCKLQYPKNPAIGYLSINSLRNKIVDLREIMSDISLDYFVVSETKLDSSFPSAQFHINGYEVRARRDRDKSGGGLIEFVRKGFIYASD